MFVTVIDLHTHVVPNALVGASARRHRLWPMLEMRGDDRAAVLIDGKAFREIDSRSWQVDRRLGDMAEDGTDIQVLSPMPELLSHWLPADVADDLSTIMNEHIAGMVAAAPSKFRGIGMVPMQDVDLATKRLDDIRARGLCGVEIGTHIDGMPLGDSKLIDFYSRAEALGLMIFVHPLHPAGLERIGGPRELAAVAVFPLETALAATSLVAGRVLEKFPNLRILLSHGGGAFPWIAPRIQYAWNMGTALSRAITQSPTETLKNFWYDTIVYDAAALRYLGECVGTDRLVVGSDYPFAIRQTNPGAFAAFALGGLPLDGNAAALLGTTFTETDTGPQATSHV
jgi:aminocarboxymuconate-semialdehyde decarboxylase